MTLLNTPTMINTPVKRAVFYQLNLTDLRDTLQVIPWGNVTGKNRLRHFFVNVNWQNQIATVGVSSGGAKGGVFFLDVQQPNGAAPITQYVVKGSSNPGRTIFAEYILQRIGLAKIPKTLALEIDPTDPNSEGMLMLTLLRDATRRRANTNNQRYDEALNFLWDNTTNQPKVAYLVVQKLFGGEQLTGMSDMLNAFERLLLQEKLAFDEFSILNAPTLSQFFTKNQATNLIIELTNLGIVQSFAYRSPLTILANNFNRNAALPNTVTQTQGKATEVKDLLNEIYDTYVALHLPPTQTFTFAYLLNYLQGQNFQAAQQLHQQLTQFITNKVNPAVQTLTSVFSNQTKVKNLGRVLASDSLIGNADRIEGGDMGTNWDNLFVVNQQNRGANKVDYPIGVIDNDALMQTYPHVAFNNPNTYIERLLNGGSELDVPPGVGAAPTSRLRSLLTDFDSWFADNFVSSLSLNNPDYQPIVDQYVNAGFSADATQGNWPQVLSWLKDGFASGLQRINNIDLLQMQRLHGSLTWQYGVDANFDFLAFQIRHKYLCAAHINRNNAQPFTLNHNAVRDQLRADFAQQRFDLIIPYLQQALDFGLAENPALLSAQEQQDIRQLLVHLSEQEQGQLVPTIPKPGSNPDKTRRRTLACVCKILLMFLNQYNNDLQEPNQRFADVSSTIAYSLARSNIRAVSIAKIYKRTLGAMLGNQRENVIGRNVVVTQCGLNPTIYWS